VKLLYALLLLPWSALGAVIPLAQHDQAKLEQLLRQAPRAFHGEEVMSGFIRKNYLLPAEMESLFSIKCSADYYRLAPIPSAVKCQIFLIEGDSSLLNVQRQGDEYLVNITGAWARETFEAMPYGKEKKFIHSLDRVWGKNRNGKHSQLFRYKLMCSPDSCEFSFAAI
jgi:hypothetical protein